MNSSDAEPSNSNLAVATSMLVYVCERKSFWNEAFDFWEMPSNERSDIQSKQQPNDAEFRGKC